MICLYCYLIYQNRCGERSDAANFAFVAILVNCRYGEQRSDWRDARKADSRRAGGNWFLDHGS